MSGGLPVNVAGFTRPQVQLLRELARAGGPVPLPELAEQLGRSVGNVGQSLRTLKQRRLVRCACTGGSPVELWALTEKGTKQLEQIDYRMSIRHTRDQLSTPPADQAVTGTAALTEHDLRARRAFGQRLRGLRVASGRTGVAFARALGWSDATVWRFEQGHQLPTEAEIQQWCRIAGATDIIPSLRAAVSAIDRRPRARRSRSGRV
ncbi:helix-turn-helix domain-containing protein [Nocardia wallacei]|uniref:helix-turn-helix domain-containing protein n=1 Tax=Nocardia wallacei TaxID=480035 RepID=UPI0024544488|nr:helix-turn-helix domain-containing protein [Nocardia wallacei]